MYHFKKVLYWREFVGQVITSPKTYLSRDANTDDSGEQEFPGRHMEKAAGNEHRYPYTTGYEPDYKNSPGTILFDKIFSSFSLFA